MKCSERISNAFSKLKSIDTFPVSTNLRSNGDDSYKTWIGFVASAGYYSLLLWAIITIGTNVLSKNEPSTQEAEKVIRLPNPATFTPDAFPIMFGIETKNPAKFFIDETIYVPTVEQKLRCKNGTKKVVNIPVVPCDPTRHATKGDLSEYFQYQMNMSTLYCIDANGTIYGDFDAAEFQYMRIRFGICKNSTSNNNHCQPLATIQNKLAIGYVSLYHPSFNRDLGNYTKPMNSIGLNIFTTIGISYTKVIDVRYEEDLIFTDVGAFYSVYKNESYSVFSEKVEMLDLVENDDLFMYFDVKMQTIQRGFYRSYEKIMNFIADLGGFVAIVFEILLRVMDPITDFLYLIHLLNVMYKRKEPSKSGLEKLGNNTFFRSIDSNDAQAFGNEFEKKSTAKFDLKSLNKSKKTSKLNFDPNIQREIKQLI